MGKSTAGTWTRRSFGLLFSIPLLFAVQEPFTIRQTVDVVLLDVSVSDAQGAYVKNLSKDSFEVQVDGKSQKIRYFGQVDAPVTVGLIVDTSGSMRYKRPEVAMAGLAFAKESNPLDEFFVVNFNDHVIDGLPAGTMFTDHLQTIRNALYFGDAAGRTSLYDAVARGLKILEQGHREKRTLVIVSDGGDNASKIRESDLMKLIQSSRATIYTIGLVSPEDNDLRPDVLKRISAISGGVYFQPREMNEVMDVLHRISIDIRSRYSVGFSPEPKRGTDIHNIRVSVPEAGRKLNVRARRSYRSQPDGGAEL